MSKALLLPVEQDRLRVQNALPGYMFALLFESLNKAGFEIREDLLELANKASAAALHGTLGAHQSQLAGIVQSDGYDVLKHAGTNEVRHLVGALARLFVKMQDEGFQVNENGLLIALGIAAEIDDGVTDWGKPHQLTRIMEKLHNGLRDKGYFLLLQPAG